MSPIGETRFKLRKSAEILGISSSTLRQWAKRGKVSCYQVSNKLQFSASELERILRGE